MGKKCSFFRGDGLFAGIQGAGGNRSWFPIGQDANKFMSLYGAKSPPAGEHSDADGMDCQIRKYIRIGNNYVLPVEEALIESGLEFTILNPAMFFQNIATGWKKAQQTGEYEEAWSARSRFSRVDFRDVAEVVALALTEDRLLHGTFELCAEGILNGGELVSLMAEVLDRPVEAKHVPLPPSDKVPAQLIEMMRWYDSHSLVGNPLTLTAILARPARSLRAFLTELLER